MPDDKSKPRTGAGAAPPAGASGASPPRHPTMPGIPTSAAADEWRRSPASTIVQAASLQPSTGAGRNPFCGNADRAPRARVAVPVRCKYNSILEFFDTQSVNISRTGMFVTTDSPAPVGSMIDFEFALDDGFMLLKGAGEVVRVVTTGAQRGMGIRFDETDDKTRKLIERIVDVNIEEGRAPTVPSDYINAAPAVNPVTGVTTRPSSKTETITLEDGKLQIVLSPASVNFFTYNPLLNVKMGGFVVPANQNVPLGTVLEVCILDVEGETLAAGKGKVVAKQEMRVGVRMTDLAKDVLGRLQAEVAKLSPAK